MAQLITSAGTVIDAKPENGKYFTLEELQSYVGGYIECLNLPKNRKEVFIINEEGRLLGLPYNKLASSLAALYGTPVKLCGNVFCCNKKQIK